MPGKDKKQDFDLSFFEGLDIPSAVESDSKDHSSASTDLGITRKRVSFLQKFIVLTIFVLVAFVAYSLFQSTSIISGASNQQTDDPNIISQNQNNQQPNENTSNNQQPEGQTSQKANVAKDSFGNNSDATENDIDENQEPVSLELAYQFCSNGDYQDAFDVFYELYEKLDKTNPPLLADFLQLQMAITLERTDSIGNARRLYAIASRSKSPAVKVIADYDRAILEYNSNNYIKSYAKAYQVIAMVQAAEFEPKIEAYLTQNAYFIAAQSLSKYVFDFSATDYIIPEDIFDGIIPFNPFKAYTIEQLVEVIEKGKKNLQPAIVAPKIARIQAIDKLNNSYCCISNAAPLEEILAKLAANENIDLQWYINSDSNNSVVNKDARKRSTTIYIKADTIDNLINIIASSAQLIPRINPDSINIMNPSEYSSLDNHIPFMAQHTINLWRTYLQKYDDPQKAPAVHFALALLLTRTDRPNEALAEYKMVANRFQWSPLATVALLNSSGIKRDIMDYDGARMDLLQLSEQYPDNEMADQIYLSLADITMNSKLYDQSFQLYRKVYFLSLSQQVKAKGAFGAGKAAWLMQDYEKAEKWMNDFINIATDIESQDIYYAYFIIGNANLKSNKLDKAVNAFKHAMQADLSTDDYMKVVSTLVTTYIAAQRYIEAFDILESVDSWRMDQNQNTQITMFKAIACREMGLNEKALTLLEQRIDYVSDNALKARMLYETAMCYLGMNKYEQARRNFSLAMASADDRDLQNNAAIKIAEIYLDSDLPEKAIPLCRRILDSASGKQLRAEAAVLLSKAYKKENNYDKAIAALLLDYKTEDAKITE